MSRPFGVIGPQIESALSAADTPHAVIMHFSHVPLVRRGFSPSDRPRVKIFMSKLCPRGRLDQWAAGQFCQSEAVP